MQVPEGRRLADPPLMRLESEGGHAYLSMLLQLSTSQTDAQQQADIEARLVSLALATLQRFQVCHTHSHAAPILKRCCMIITCNKVVQWCKV